MERGIYRLAGIDPAAEQKWLDYAIALIAFNGAGVVALYALQRLQDVLPFNPQYLAAVAPDLALNTAVSFATNTSWQSYSGETTLGYLTQMAGITVTRALLCALLPITVAATLFLVWQGVPQTLDGTVGVTTLEADGN